MLSPERSGAGIVRMHQGVPLVELGEMHESFRWSSIQHQLRVHPSDLEAVGDRTMMAEVLVHTREFFVRLAVLDQVQVRQDGRRTRACGPIPPPSLSGRPRLQDRRDVHGADVGYCSTGTIRASRPAPRAARPGASERYPPPTSQEIA